MERTSFELIGGKNDKEINEPYERVNVKKF